MFTLTLTQAHIIHFRSSKRIFSSMFLVLVLQIDSLIEKKEIKQVLLFRLGPRFRSAPSSSVCWLVKSIRVTLSSAGRDFNSPEGNLVRMDKRLEIRNILPVKFNNDVIDTVTEPTVVKSNI